MVTSSVLKAEGSRCDPCEVLTPVRSPLKEKSESRRCRSNEHPQGGAWKGYNGEPERQTSAGKHVAVSQGTMTPEPGTG